jgi:hypothetical protein
LQNGDRTGSPAYRVEAGRTEQRPAAEPPAVPSYDQKTSALGGSK